MLLAAATSTDIDYTPFIFVWLVFGFIGLLIGNSKNMGCAGFMLGVLLGPIGLIIIAVMGNKPTSTLDKIQARPVGAGWHPDPLGRFNSRWYDGNRWTQHVGRVEADGTHRQFEDPL